MKRYDPAKIEPKWQQIWEDTGIYKTPDNPGQDKHYCLTMFPYPSGDLHTGHWYAYTGPDIVARYQRMIGKKVLYPFGFDAFGLPAENAAIKRGIPPADWTDDNITNMRQQIKSLGPAYDWEREITTSKPDYYKWTQWLFLLLYRHGLAYKSKGIVNWCPSCQTVLANEQVVNEDGKNVCERCGTEVTQKELEQWYFKITDYADRLLDDLDALDWPARVKTMQKNWIGKSIGAEVHFKVDGSRDQIEIFTTRPDTLYGATYMVLAPEHPLVGKLTTDKQKKEVKAYVKAAAAKTELDRMEGEKEKSGVLTGSYAINPANDEKIPVLVADYVLMGYGTGAIMAVPAHDERDYEFAKKYDLPIRTVIEPITGEPQENPEQRSSIVALVKNPKTGEVLSINWGKEFGGNLLIGGGLEEGEDPVKCAEREIAEETGYKNLKFIAKSETIHHHYFAHSKNKARQIAAVGLYFELASDKQTKQKLERDEHGKFEVEWLKPEEAEKKIKDELHSYVYHKFTRDRVYTGEGMVINSGKYNGMDSAAMREQVTRDIGKERVNYRLRDWLISRQRYWGAPIPIIYCDKCGTVPVPEKDLPVELPEDVEFEPTGKSPLLSRDDFVKTECPQCDGEARREVDTMDTFVDSSWYFLRYPNNKYDQGVFDPAAVKQWMPVDHYLGGIEHAILHLLYARFITKVLADHAELGFSEPFTKLSNQGTILGPDGAKMSKSRGNVVSPDEQVGKYGADTFRLYLMFIGPWDEGGPFATRGIAGTRRFLERVWALVNEYINQQDKSQQPEVSRVDNQAKLETRLAVAANKTIRKVTQDVREMGFNTAIATLMELTNTMYKLKVELPVSASPDVWRPHLEQLLLMLAPMAPHITEELWQALGQEESIHVQAWPAWDEKLIAEDLVNIVVQVNGKVRANVVVPANEAEEAVADAARRHANVAKHLKGKEVTKTIFVTDRLINFVIK